MQIADLQVGDKLEYVHDSRYPSGTGYSQPPRWVACEVVRVNGVGELPAAELDFAEDCPHAIIAKEFVLPRALELATGQGSVAAKRGDDAVDERRFRRGQDAAQDEVDAVYQEPAIPVRVQGMNDGGYREVMFCLPHTVLAGIPERNGDVKMERADKVGVGKLRRRGFGRESGVKKQASLF